ncbi:MAG: alpha/beta hydrolase [Anaerolineales bacterium]
MRKLLLLLAILLALAIGALACTPPEANIPTATPSAAAAAPTHTASPRPTEEPTASPTPDCQSEQGEVKRSSYRSRLLSSEVSLWIYVPPCYPIQDERLPGVFFFHGKPFDQSHWAELGLVDTYERGLVQGRWDRAILILPKLPEPLFSSSDGGPGSYEEEFLEAVLPVVEAEYQLADPPVGRHLAGISRGGIWALEIGLGHADLFGRIAALSPSLAVNYPRPAYDPFNMVQVQQEVPENILLLAGEEDWARPKTEELAAALATVESDVQLRIVPGDHRDPTWEAVLPLVLDFLVAK